MGRGGGGGTLAVWAIYNQRAMFRYRRMQSCTRPTPLPPSLLPDLSASAIAAGGYGHMCAIVSPRLPSAVKTAPGADSRMQSTQNHAAKPVRSLSTYSERYLLLAVLRGRDARGARREAPVLATARVSGPRLAAPRPILYASLLSGEERKLFCSLIRDSSPVG